MEGESGMNIFDKLSVYENEMNLITEKIGETIESVEVCSNTMEIYLTCSGFVQVVKGREEPTYYNEEEAKLLYSFLSKAFADENESGESNGKCGISCRLGIADDGLRFFTIRDRDTDRAAIAYKNRIIFDYCPNCGCKNEG
tara:strand:- start:8092 stop:8514 length:423 start_codon:yes stop_codon:yes gene_type:complete